MPLETQGVGRGQRPVRIALAVASVSIAFGWSGRSDAACPRSEALAPKSATNRYQQRGDRCEGIYATPVSTSSRPRIIGFHRQAFPSVPFATTRTTAFEVQAPPQVGGMSVRAVSLRPKTYYAMDIDLSGGRDRYAWETSILSAPALSMRANELGVLACDNRCAPAPVTRYYPARLLTPAAGAADAGYVLIFQSDVGIDSAVVTLSDATGAVVAERKLAGRFVGSWPISTRVGFPRTGSYRVRFVGEASDGTRLSNVFTIVIP